MYAKDIMENKLIYVYPSDKIKLAVGKMVENDISGIPVVDSNINLLGIVTETDILNYGKLKTMPEYLELLETILHRQTPETYKEELLKTLDEEVKNVMNPDAITVTPTTPIGEISMIMTDKDINRVLVIDNKRVVGVISRKDILMKIVEFAQEEEN